MEISLENMMNFELSESPIVTFFGKDIPPLFPQDLAHKSSNDWID